MLNWIPVIWFQNMSAGLVSGSSSLESSVTTIHSQTKVLCRSFRPWALQTSVWKPILRKFKKCISRTLTALFSCFLNLKSLGHWWWQFLPNGLLTTSLEELWWGGCCWLGCWWVMELVVGVISRFGPCAVLSKCPKQAKLQRKGECVGTHTLF